MQTSLRSTLALLISAILVSSCNSAAKEKPVETSPSTVGTNVVSETESKVDSKLREQVQNPKLGDVYVVQFHPSGKPETQYFFYKVVAVRPTEVDLTPARKESADPQASLVTIDFEGLDKVMTYTRAQALELLQEQPGDVQHTQLILVRR